MKETGIVRRLDDLGRIVIPKEIRRTLHLKEEDAMEIFIDGDFLCLKKYDELRPLVEYFDFVIKDLRYAYNLDKDDKDKILCLLKEAKDILLRED